MKRATRGAVSALAVLTMTGTLLVVGASAAQADQFDPNNSAPTINLVTSTLTMQPAVDGTSATYSVDVTVGDADTLADLNQVSLCIYEQASGDPACLSTGPKDEVKILWARSTDTFAVDEGPGTNDFWSNQASVSNYSAAATSMTMTFNFKISEAAIESTSWALRAEVNDGDTPTVANDTTGYTVNYFGNVDVGRASQNFGTIAAGSSAVANDIGAAYMVNGQSDIAYRLNSDFRDAATPQHVAATAGGAPGTAPTAGQVAFDCSPEPTFTQGTAARIGTGSSSDVEEDVFPGGLAEGGTNSLPGAKQSCRLSNGGGLPRAGSPYVANVITTVHADN